MTSSRPASRSRALWRIVAVAALVASSAGAGWAAAHTPFRTSRPADQGQGDRGAKRSLFTVAVLGDGFGEALAEGLKLNFANQGDIAIIEKTHAPFGLAQDDKFEWSIAAKNLLASQDHVDAVVIMLGANDWQPIKDGPTSIEPQTPRWRQLYGDRVEAVAALFRDKGIPLTWVGLPVVQDAGLSAEFVALNEIIRDRAVKAGASYVDSWEAFVDEGGQYSGIGPDLNGQVTKLRTADGIDFTRAGARKLASFVEPDLRRDRESRRPAAPDPEAIVMPEQPDFDNALQIDVNAQIRREAGLPALPSSEPDGRARGPIGPIVPITTPALSADGRLADSRSDASPLGGERLLQRSLVEGQPIQPKPGRIDDFSWPRP
jgi:hypothetical protein